MLLRPSSLRPLLPLVHVPLSASGLPRRGRPTPLRLPVVAAAARRMRSSPASGDCTENPGRPNPTVAKVQSLLANDQKGGWEKCWEEGLTPWDIGNPTPVILHLLQTGSLPNGRALVPGCGSGHDVVAMACPERFVVGLDISESAIKKACEWTSTLPNKNCFTFLAEDFFTWHTDELFDLIFDYTFFCAIDPDMRSAWANKIQNLLKPDGELITLMFPVGDYVGGPPYAVSVAGEWRNLAGGGENHCNLKCRWRQHLEEAHFSQDSAADLQYTFLVHTRPFLSTSMQNVLWITLFCDQVG